MHLWVLTLVCTAVYGISRISELDFIAVNFAKAIEGHKLNGSVIKEVEVDSESSCQFECVREEKCKSYNFETTKNDAGTSTCQLSDSDRFFSFANFTEDKNFIYRGWQSTCETDRSLCGEKGVCIPNYQDDSVKCKCNDGYTGKPCKPKSCTQLFQDGFSSSGVYTINPDGGKPIQVLCDMTTDGGGWTVFQKRVDGSVDFYLGWKSYKNGFGELNGEFWLGNDNLHRLTAADDVMLRVDLEDLDNKIRYAEYTTFKVADEGDKYRLLIGGYNGTAGDSMAVHGAEYGGHDGTLFSTQDEDNDVWSANCAQRYKGAWWYNACHASNLNGLYLNGSHSSYADGVNWYSFRGHHYSLKRTEMKVKPKV
ncbi:microfibril-associated glycoprotein 4-like [Oculina patagonica]